MFPVMKRRGPVLIVPSTATRLVSSPSVPLALGPARLYSSSSALPPLEPSKPSSPFPSTNPLANHAASASRYSSQFGKAILCCLVGSPSTWIPEDLTRFISRATGDSNHLLRSFSIPDPTLPWSLQSHLLFLSSPRTIPPLLSSLSDHPTQYLIKVSKYQPAYAFLRAICPPSSTTLPPIHPWSSRAVLIQGVPANLPPAQLEQSLLSFSLPIQPVTSLDAHQRYRLGMYWPIWDPPSRNARIEPHLNSNQTSITRHQIVYTFSPAMACHLAAELHWARPAWLGSTLKSTLPHQQPAGWELRARVIY